MKSLSRKKRDCPYGWTVSLKGGTMLYGTVLRVNIVILVNIVVSRFCMIATIAP